MTAGDLGDYAKYPLGDNLGQNLNERPCVQSQLFVVRPCVRSQLFVVRWASNRASVPTVIQFTFTRLVCAAIKHARSPRSLMGSSAQSEGDYVLIRMVERYPDTVERLANREGIEDRRYLDESKDIFEKIVKSYPHIGSLKEVAVCGRPRTQVKRRPHGRTGGIGASESSFATTLRHAVIRSATSRSSTLRSPSYSPRLRTE